MTVLLADDYLPLRSSMRQVLEAFGHRVIEAGDGFEALSVMAEENIDVLVLDLHMPVCDGFEVLRRLDGCHPSVIVLSGFDNESRAELETEFGSRVYRCLQKPASIDKLIQAVSGALALSRQTSDTAT